MIERGEDARLSFEALESTGVARERLRHLDATSRCRQVSRARYLAHAATPD
jgi:hypothetical protein